MLSGQGMRVHVPTRLCRQRSTHSVGQNAHARMHACPVHPSCLHVPGVDTLCYEHDRSWHGALQVNAGSKK